MPTYEYLCESCGYRFEKFQNMSDLPLDNCPKCGRQVRKLLSPGTGVIMKGNRSCHTDCKNNDTEGKTCCGREERCEHPHCSGDEVCKR